MNQRVSRRLSSCWVVSDGRVGIEIQCRGLAEALGFDPAIKRIKTRAPWRWLPPAFWRDPLRALDPAGDRLAPPWPDLVIGTGRQAVAPNLAIRRASGGRTVAIQIQDPKVAPERFDLVIAPEHDGLTGANVIATRGSLHGLTEAHLAVAAARLAPKVDGLPKPRVGVLIGGKSRVHSLPDPLARRLGEGLADMARGQGVGLIVTPSRRTEARTMAILREALAGLPAYVWDGQRDDQGDNPYRGILGLADAFVVTGDSVNMVCEAAFTGKPVHTAEVAGGTPKFRHFHAAMERDGITRPFAGRLESWHYAPLRETESVAAEIRRRLGLAEAAPPRAGVGGAD